MKLKQHLLLLMILVFASASWADTVRGTKTTVLVPIDHETIERVPIKQDEILILRPSITSNIIEGLEIAVTIPEAYLSMGTGLALNAYNSISPNPNEEITSYRGNSLFFSILPASSVWYLQIPLSQNHTLKEGAVTTLMDRLSLDSGFPLALQIEPVMKGLPQAVEEADFLFSIRPLYKNLGYLSLNLEGLTEAEETSLELLIDDKLLKYSNESFLLETGLHSLTISSESFTDIEHQFGIERGKTTELSLTILRESPTVLFEFPEESMLYFDGQRLENFINTLIPTKIGRHTVTLQIGDYSITKEVEITENKNYRISLLLDVIINN